MKEQAKIPVILVTGFLGSGKTTFINELIKAHPHVKLALVENEFGMASIDAELIVGMRSENIFDLSNGCICCSISNEFSLTLLDLAEKAGEIDYLLIETTGVADLSNIIRPFYGDEDLKKRFHLLGSICLVDALNVDEQLNGHEQHMQVILSDLLLINKTAGLDERRLAEIERRLTAFNSSATIFRTNFSQLEGFHLEDFAEKNQVRMEQKLMAPRLFPVIESKKFTTFTHQFPGELDLDRFQYWFNYFVAINQLEIYRVKGVLFPKNSPDKVIVQAVGGAVSYTSGSLILPSEQHLNTLVFIGKDIDHTRIAVELDRYLNQAD
ncbi:CobW family GTP-binding protein [Gaoshiqia sp. Z1-71]|uniref:CobW family GTP-binding protein n=1 Tax=Gaoshiqia hydrogeniformans TaxID=3290090 RepID=UPI003BF80602